tara:strand:- start:55 stop:309 length:255 start_codon:yes stop_codon:yes gene_type:complete
MISTPHDFKQARRMLTGELKDPAMYGAEMAAGVYAALAILLDEAMRGAVAQGKLFRAQELDRRLAHATQALDNAMACMTRPINY